MAKTQLLWVGGFPGAGKTPLLAAAAQASIVNARGELPPAEAELEALVAAAVARLAATPIRLHRLQPGRPRPSHRYRAPVFTA